MKTIEVINKPQRGHKGRRGSVYEIRSKKWLQFYFKMYVMLLNQIVMGLSSFSIVNIYYSFEFLQRQPQTCLMDVNDSSRTQSIKIPFIQQSIWMQWHYKYDSSFSHYNYSCE